MKTYEVKTRFGEYTVRLERGIYGTNGNLAITMTEVPTGEPFATLTVNLDELPAGFAYLDTNNCPWAPDFVKENNLGKFANHIGVSGFCSYPLYDFTETYLDIPEMA